MEDINIGIIIAQLINFAILYFVFKKFLGDKIVKAIEERKAKIKKIEKLDAEMKERLLASQKEAETLLSESRKKSEEIIGEAENIAKTKKKNLLEQAENEAQDIITSGKQEVEKEKLSMLSDVKGNIVDLVLKFNTKMFGNEKVSSEFVAKEIDLMK